MILPGGVKRIEGTFTDELDALYDPSAAVIKIYDSEGVLIATKALADCIRKSLGVWYLDYPVPSTGIVGRWTVSWVNTVAGKDYGYPFGFIVWNLTWPTVAEVRVNLGDMGVKRLSNEGVENQISYAAGFVGYGKGDDAPYQKIYQAILARATYQCYVTYVAEYERTAGKLPEAVDRQIRRYEMIADKAMASLQSGAVLGIITLVNLRGNTIEDNT